MIVADTPDFKIERREVPIGHKLSLLSRVYIERGTKEDWDLLHELHYKAENLGIGPIIYRCILDGRVIGVGVMTVPKMLSSGRNRVMVNMRPNVNGRDTKLVNRHRALWLNKHTCTNSRLVLDTTYRGAGIAYRMQNLMMRMTGCKFIEFQSSMSKFNPFALKAGVRFTPPARSAHYEAGIKFFARWFESAPMDYVSIMNELEKMPNAVRERCIAETRKFYYRCSSMEKSGDNRANGTTRVDNMEVGTLIKSLQQLVLASPLYGLYKNPDQRFDDENGGQDAPELPERLPLLAFDNQKLGEPLDVSKALKHLERYNLLSDIPGRV